MKEGGREGGEVRTNFQIYEKKIGPFPTPRIGIILIFTPEVDLNQPNLRLSVAFLSFNFHQELLFDRISEYGKPFDVHSFLKPKILFIAHFLTIFAVQYSLFILG